jgi:Tfp pilus assembly protein PilF
MIRFKLDALVLLLTVFALCGCSSDEQKRQSHYDKGKAFFDKGEYKSAKIEFKNAVQIDPKFVQAHLMIAETSLNLGDAQDAFRSYLKPKLFSKR